MINCAVLLNIYPKDKINLLSEAISSVIEQLHKPSELLIVSDGPATSEQKKIINDFVIQSSVPIRLSETPTQQGLWAARNYGLNFLNSEYVALMDADDVMHRERLQRQLKFMERYPEVDILGTAIFEIDLESRKVSTLRTAPTTHKEIIRKLKYLNVLFHPTVLLRREVVLKAGGYKNFYLAEDYELWTRLAGRGAIFANLPLPTLGFRIDRQFYQRRGGVKFLNQEIRLRRQIVSNLGINFGLKQFVVLISRVIFRTVPTPIRKVIYVYGLGGNALELKLTEIEFLNNTLIDLKY